MNVDYPREIIAPGTRLDFVHAAPMVGTSVVTYAKGRFRRALVLRNTPTRVLCGYQYGYGAPKAHFRRLKGAWHDRVFFAPVDDVGSYVVHSDESHPRYAHTLHNYFTGEQVCS